MNIYDYVAIWIAVGLFFGLLGFLHDYERGEEWSILDFILLGSYSALIGPFMGLLLGYHVFQDKLTWEWLTKKRWGKNL